MVSERKTDGDVYKERFSHYVVTVLSKVTTSCSKCHRRHSEVQRDHEKAHCTLRNAGTIDNSVVTEGNFSRHFGDDK